MSEKEVLWEGVIRLVMVKNGDDVGATWSCDFDLDKLEDVFKLRKHQFGEHLITLLRLEFIGLLEVFKNAFMGD